MRLRFVEDKRTLVWALALFPLAPALALSRPSLLPWLAPLLLYCSYLSGVLTHNHNHSPVFYARRLNSAYGAWLSIFYGFPIFSWIPTHNQNHHRFQNGEGDMTATARHAPTDSLLAALTYPLASSRYQLPALVRFVDAAFRTRSARAWRIALELATVGLAHAAFLTLAVTLHGLHRGAIVYVFALGLPALLGTYWMMLTNLQHVGCDPTSEHDHSRNFVSRLGNWLVFDNGYHTVHHEHPSLHWSRYRELHRRRERQIAPELKQRTILHFVVRRYLTGAVSPGLAAADAAETSSARTRPA